MPHDNTPPSLPPPTSRRAGQRLLASLMASAAALVAACRAPAPGPGAVPPARPSGAAPAAVGPLSGAAVSAAATPRAYRRDAATHLYALNSARIYQGQLPPQLYAIGVLEVDIDRAGRVGRLHWLRAPRHAPEVVAEIERTVRAAAPFPPPARLGRVVYTDTWLWDRSGHFQLDTLTEGQR